MPKWTDVFDINASIRIIRHISGGIYRNPANAMKELIVNAFDAGATRVDVDLEGPTSISKVAISDNGQGLSEDDMVFSLQHVGSSLKRLRPEKFEGISRPIVGQFGIGLLAAAHASTSILIESNPKGANYSLEIEIDLTPFFKYETQIQTLEDFTYGTVKYKKLSRAQKQSGTRITLAKGDEPEAKRFWATLNKVGLEYFSSDRRKSGFPNNFDGFAQWIDKHLRSATVSDLRGYEEFMWHLGLILPIEYLEDGPIREGYRKSVDKESTAEIQSIIARMRRRVADYDFHVFVDGIEVRRPIILPSNVSEKGEELKPGEWGAFPISYGKGKAEAEGYLFFQPYRVRPMELRGIYPRLKGVGVGKYDNTLFNMARQNPILAYQISGELNLQSGFDDALNLDRTDFISTDRAYMDLVAYMTRRLGEEKGSILHQIRETRTSRQERREQEKEEATLDIVKEEAKEVFPSFKVHSVPRRELRTFEDPDSDYSEMRISYSHKYVAVSDKIAKDPLLVKILLVIDKVLHDYPQAKEFARELKEAIRKMFVEDRSR